MDSTFSKSWGVQYSVAVSFLLSQFSAKTNIVLYFIWCKLGTKFTKHNYAYALFTDSVNYLHVADIM